MNHPILTVLRIRSKKKNKSFWLQRRRGNRQPKYPHENFVFSHKIERRRNEKKKSKLFSEKRSSMAQSVWRVFTYVCVDRKKQNEKSLNLQSSSRINVNYKCFGLQCWHSASDANTRLPTSCHCKTFRWEFSFSMEHTHTPISDHNNIRSFQRKKNLIFITGLLLWNQIRKHNSLLCCSRARPLFLSLPLTFFSFCTLFCLLLSSSLSLKLWREQNYWKPKRRTKRK